MKLSSMFLMFDGRKIQELRESYRFDSDGKYGPVTQAQLADAIHVATMTISRAERNESCSPELLESIARYFKVDWRTLLSDPREPRPGACKKCLDAYTKVLSRRQAYDTALENYQKQIERHADNAEELAAFEAWMNRPLVEEDADLS